jgi:AcrR family transcriptional regulator
MARIVKEEEYTARRNEIIDAAQRLIFSKGYEEMSIQDVIDALGISKGAFYHYFKSKQALLEAIVMGMTHELLQVIDPIVNDAHLTAMQKLQCYFDTGASWKSARKEVLLPYARAWCQDSNVMMRECTFNTLVAMATPQLGQIIRQGVEEGVFNTPYPEQIARVIFTLLQGMSGSMLQFVLSEAGRDASLKQAQTDIAVYTDTLERILGLPSHSLNLIDINMLRKWIEPSIENHPQQRSEEHETIPSSSMA